MAAKPAVRQGAGGRGPSAPPGRTGRSAAKTGSAAARLRRAGGSGEHLDPQLRRPRGLVPARPRIEVRPRERRHDEGARTPRDEHRLPRPRAGEPRPPRPQDLRLGRLERACTLDRRERRQGQGAEVPLARRGHLDRDRLARRDAGLPRARLEPNEPTFTAAKPSGAPAGSGSHDEVDRRAPPADAAHAGGRRPGGASGPTRTAASSSNGPSTVRPGRVGKSARRWTR